MAILSVTLEWAGFGGRDDVDSSEYRQRYRVIFNDSDLPQLRPLIAMLGPYPGPISVPQGFSRHQHSPYLVVVEREIRTLGPFDFEIDIVYSNKANYPSAESMAVNFINPVDGPPEIEWSFLNHQEAFDVSMNEVNNQFTWPVTNSVGQLFDPLPTKERADLLLRITRAETYYDYQKALNYINTVNADTFYGFAPKVARCVEFSGRQMRLGAFLFWQVSYAIQFRLDTWTIYLEDAGFSKKVYVPGGWDTEAITQKDGSKIVEPVPLNGDGQKLAPGLEAVRLPFRVYPERAFSDLDIQY